MTLKPNELQNAQEISEGMVVSQQADHYRDGIKIPQWCLFARTQKLGLILRCATLELASHTLTMRIHLMRDSPKPEIAP